MTEDETDAVYTASAPLAAANDNGANARPAIDPRILVIARAIGRQIARDQIEEMQAANDNTSRDD